MIVRRINFIILLIASGCMACAQPPIGVMRPQEKLLKHFHDYVDNGELAGTSILLYHDGKITTDLYGLQHVEAHVPLTEETIFRWASMTKPIVAVAIFQLVERGLLDLDDEAGKYLPEINTMMIYAENGDLHPAMNKITIKHLLSHMSGSTSFLDLTPAGKNAGQIIRSKNISNLDELVEAIAEAPLAFEPGQGWAYGYSNDLLAKILENVTGETIDTYLQKNIFEPLKMSHTGFHVSNVDLLAAIYKTGERGIPTIFEEPVDSKYISSKNYARGNGGLAGPIGDYLHFCQMLLGRGSFSGNQIVSPESVDIMMKNVVPDHFRPIKIADNPMVGQGYGLGFGIAMEDTPQGRPGDVYWPGSLYTYFFVNVEDQKAAIFMTQLYDMNKMPMIWEFHALASNALRSIEQ